MTRSRGPGHGDQVRPLIKQLSGQLSGSCRTSHIHRRLKLIMINYLCIYKENNILHQDHGNMNEKKKNKHE